MFQAIYNTISTFWTGINSTIIIDTDQYDFTIGQVLIGTAIICVLSQFIRILIVGKDNKND